MVYDIAFVYFTSLGTYIESYISILDYLVNIIIQRFHKKREIAKAQQ